MRVRLTALPPLPAHKAWYVVPSALRDDPLATVQNLKRALCNDIFNEHEPEQLSLFVDGFEILDDTNFEVVQNDDLITAKLSVATQKAATVAVKRKLVQDDELDTLPKKRAKLSVVAPVMINQARSSATPAISSSTSSASASSTSSSSSTDSDSSSNDDSTSDSDSDSNTSSSSSSASAAETRTQNKAKQIMPSHPLVGYESKSRVVSQPLVPPGHGKASTKARNARRRRQRQSQQEEHVGTGNVSHEVSEMSENPERLVSTPLPVQVTSEMLRNKGKRKSFLSGAPEGPARIVFESSTEQVQDEARRPQTLPRLVPPSERRDLPKNVFVTSVDVEEDLWGKKRRRKNNRNQPVEDVNYDTSLFYGDETQSTTETNERDAQVQQNNGLAAKPSLDIKWPTLLRITAPPAVGTTLAWQTLDINPATLSPEVMIRTGSVHSLEADGTIIRLAVTRAEVAFGAFLDDGSAGAEEETEELEINLADVLDKDNWRIVSQ